jgi:tRNA modification GTPase
MEPNNSTKTTAAVTTAKGTAAIASIHLAGQSAKTIIEKIFKPHSTKKAPLEPSAILVGNIIDRDRIIDEVVIGCEAPDTFTINCHGNPLIVEMIMKLLKDHGADLVTAEQMLAAQFAQATPNAITAEAKLVQLKALTIEGVKIVSSQIDKGLAKTASHWMNDFDKLTLEQIQNECERILADSQIAHLIINGTTLVIAGPPNSGKSTLLNCLSGKQKAIVAELPGTTRDYVDSTCRIGPIVADLIDTAGLDEKLTISSIDAEAQNRTLRLIKESDLLLLVLDSSTSPETTKLTFPKGLKSADRLLVVLNKSDLTPQLDKTILDFDFVDAVTISAKYAAGIEELTKKILKILHVDSFEPTTPICFTERQRKLLQNIINTKSKPDAKPLITQLLNAPVCV